MKSFDSPPIIVWFRQDLRIADNPALTAASGSGRPIIPLFILDDSAAGEWRLGAASRWWLHQSLGRLSESLDGQLSFCTGDTSQLLTRIARETGAEKVVWNRCYEPSQIALGRKVREECGEAGIEAESFNASLLFEPQMVKKPDGTPYKVFTPYYRNGCLKRAPQPRHAVGVPEEMLLRSIHTGCGLSDLALLPAIRWYEDMAECWQPGEDGAHDRLEQFLAEGIANYREGRNRPDLGHVSRLSPHLHFGEISPFQVWHAAKSYQAMSGYESEVDHFLSELGWREFSNYVLFHNPTLPRENLQNKFDRFAWQDDPEALERWQRGGTGYPIVDAGMRELWQTGYMHNRVRMIVGSFLVKNLMLHWHHGEDWFWDTLVDADLANNSASWQWIAGCGADAAPYFRIFNPVTQGQKFDPDGKYVCRYIPELASLPSKYVHAPWLAPSNVLEEAGLELGSQYPLPIVDLKSSREYALQAFANLKA